MYRASTILFQILFEHKFITKIPRQYFLPYQSKYNLEKRSKLAKVSIFRFRCLIKNNSIDFNHNDSFLVLIRNLCIWLKLVLEKIYWNYAQPMI